MTAADLKAAIEADPTVCRRCGLVACSCWGVDGPAIMMAPTGKANIVAMKLVYDKVWDSFEPKDWGSW